MAKQTEYFSVGGAALPLTEYCQEVFRYRELLLFFLWRDIVVRYKQAFLGVVWVILRPLLTIALFTFVFSTIARFPTPGVNYPLFVLAAMLPWQLFAACVTDAGATLTNHAQLIRKAYFPRILLPLSAVVVHTVDFAINLALFLAIAPWLGPWPQLSHLMLVPLVLLWTLMLCWGVSFWLTPLAGLYHDFRFLIAFFVQLGVFVSPVGYGSYLIPERFMWLYALNPLVGLIDAYRYCLLGLSHEALAMTVGSSLALSALLFVGGLLFYKKMENTLVDVI